MRICSGENKNGKMLLRFWVLFVIIMRCVTKTWGYGPTKFILLLHQNFLCCLLFLEPLRRRHMSRAVWRKTVRTGGDWGEVVTHSWPVIILSPCTNSRLGQNQMTELRRLCELRRLKRCTLQRIGLPNKIHTSTCSVDALL